MADVGKRIRKELGRNYPNFVLVACSEPSEDGQISVEMWKEGDPVLLSYLLEGALEVLSEDCENEEEALSFAHGEL